MPSAKLPLLPAQVGFLQLRVRSVDGSLVALNLFATDHRIVIGQDCDYLIGMGWRTRSRKRDCLFGQARSQSCQKTFTLWAGPHA